jgi:hypothetical protein
MHDDELESDGPLQDAMASLDPAANDSTYWMRFQVAVLSDASRELARRRMMAQVTVAEVLNSWSRAVMPTTLLAAAVAGLLLVQAPKQSGPTHAGVEELLVSEIPSETVPLLLSPDAAQGVVAFASDVF